MFKQDFRDAAAGELFGEGLHPGFTDEALIRDPEGPLESIGRADPFAGAAKEVEDGAGDGLGLEFAPSLFCGIRFAGHEGLLAASFSILGMSAMSSTQSSAERAHICFRGMNCSRCRIVPTRTPYVVGWPSAAVA